VSCICGEIDLRVHQAAHSYVHHRLSSAPKNSRPHALASAHFIPISASRTHRESASALRNKLMAVASGQICNGATEHPCIKAAAAARHSAPQSRRRPLGRNGATTPVYAVTALVSAAASSPRRPQWQHRTRANIDGVILESATTATQSVSRPHRRRLYPHKSQPLSSRQRVSCFDLHSFRFRRASAHARSDVPGSY
jgi:hypothetical protein